jgi:hypothetical protein
VTCGGFETAGGGGGVRLPVLSGAWNAYLPSTSVVNGWVQIRPAALVTVS